MIRYVIFLAFLIVPFKQLHSIHSQEKSNLTSTETLSHFFELFTPYSEYNNNNNHDNQPNKVELNSEKYSPFFVHLLENSNCDSFTTPLSLAAKLGKAEWVEFLTNKHESFTFSFYCSRNSTIYTIDISEDEQKSKIEDHIDELVEFRTIIESAVENRSEIEIYSNFSLINEPIMKKGETPLTYALKYGSETIFKKIHFRGGKLNTPNVKRETVQSLNPEIYKKFMYKIQKCPAFSDCIISFNTQAIQELIDTILYEQDAP